MVNSGVSRFLPTEAINQWPFQESMRYLPQIRLIFSADVREINLIPGEYAHPKWEPLRWWEAAIGAWPLPPSLQAESCAETIHVIIIYIDIVNNHSNNQTIVITIQKYNISQQPTHKSGHIQIGFHGFGFARNKMTWVQRVFRCCNWGGIGETFQLAKLGKDACGSYHQTQQLGWLTDWNGGWLWRILIHVHRCRQHFPTSGVRGYSHCSWVEGFLVGPYFSLFAYITAAKILMYQSHCFFAPFH